MFTLQGPAGSNLGSRCITLAPQRSLLKGTTFQKFFEKKELLNLGLLHFIFSDWLSTRSILIQKPF